MDTATTANSSANEAVAARERFSKDLQLLVSDAQRMMQDASQYDDAQLARLKQRLRSEIDRLGQQFATFEADAQAKVKQSVKQTDQAVHAHPYAAMGLAATAGVLIGLLVARR